MASSDREMSNELLVFGWSHLVQSDLNISIPYEIMKLFFVFYYETYQILKFSTKYKSCDGLELLSNNKCVKRIPAEQSGPTYRWILGHSKPVFDGKHCWRVHSENPNKGWIVYGISAPIMHQDTFSVPNAYGITYWDQYYPSNHTSTNCGNLSHFNESVQCEIDIFLDATKGELRLCVIGMTNKCEPEFRDLPINTNHGWVPYFILAGNDGGENCAFNTKLKIVKIPIEWYAKSEPNVFNYC